LGANPSSRGGLVDPGGEGSPSDWRLSIIWARRWTVRALPVLGHEINPEHFLVIFYGEA
jgi:hypothetical protein